MTNLYKSKIYLLLSFILLFTCKDKQEYIVEQNIYNAIFNNLLDSTIYTKFIFNENSISFDT